MSKWIVDDEGLAHSRHDTKEEAEAELDQIRRDQAAKIDSLRLEITGVEIYLEGLTVKEEK